MVFLIPMTTLEKRLGKHIIVFHTFILQLSAYTVIPDQYSTIPLLEYKQII